MSAKLSIKDIVRMAICVSLMAICAWITVPATVPFTLQTFAVFFTAGLLGSYKGALSVVVYILLGVIGAPVFSGFRGGIDVILNTTGGYVVGFAASAIIVGIISKNSGFIRLSISMLIGLIVCYAFGTAWFLFMYAKNTGPVGLWTALTWCVFPFIVPDVLKIALAAGLVVKLRSIIHK